MSIQNGKRPLASKPKPTALNLDDIFGNKLGVDPEILKKIEAKGLTYRFVNAKQLESNGGHHEFGWRPVTMKEIGYDTMDTHTFQFGQSPDGFVRRGDLILAVRTKELTEKHKKYIEQENDRVSLTTSQKAHADELRQLASRTSGIKIHEGYEENE